MKNQIIPDRNSVALDDTIIRIVNENHDRHVRLERERLEREAFEQREKIERRKQMLYQFANDLLCAAIGSVATICWLIFMV